MFERVRTQRCLRLFLRCASASVAGLFALCLTAGGASAEAGGGPSLVERYSPSVEVSGEVLVGAMFAGGAASTRITVYGLRPSDRQVCLAIVSRDGRYKATMRVPLQRTSGAFSFDFRTQYAQELRGLEGQLVLLARSASADAPCQLSRGDILLASWGEPQKSAQFSVVANSLQARVSGRVEFQATGASDGKAPLVVPGDCSRITGVTIAYDTSCTVVIPQAACGESVAVLNRRQGTMRFVDRAVIRVPCP